MWDSYEQLRFQLSAVLWNVYDWWALSVLKQTPLPDDEIDHDKKEDYCYLIHRPGSIHQVRKRKLGPKEATIGYNYAPYSPGPVIEIPSTLPEDGVVLKVTHFSVNYADVCIRWGLYDSANKFVGWPICPGFDVAGVVEQAGSKCGFKAGEQVFGATLFGGYSTKVLVPARQLRKVPKGVLVHTAAGGVGTMLCTLARQFGCSPVVGVVGRPQKVKALKDMRICDSVALKSELWKSYKSAKDLEELENASEYKKIDPPVEASTGKILDENEVPDNIDDLEFQAVFDANGQETLQKSYDHTALGGRVIVYGFHTNVPSGGAAAFLNPWQWLKMVLKMAGPSGMPHFDPMKMTVASKGVIGFNLSFFSKETEVLKYYFDLVTGYVEKGVIGNNLPITILKDAREAHTVLSSAQTVGKLVVEL
eukprot:g11828.t1